MPLNGLRRFVADITPFFCLLLAIVTLGPHQFGFHLAELNAPQDVITCRKKNIRGASTQPSHSLRGLLSSGLIECIPMNEAAFATASSIFTVGGLVGALAAGPICSRKGRLLSMRITATIFLLGSIVETLAESVATLAVGRVLNGIGAGASTVIVPLYISEVAPAASRGFFGAFTQITVNIGILLTQTLGYFLSHGTAWRLILGTGIVIAIVQFLGLLVVPESPAWLLAHRGDVVRARRILQRIRGAKANLDGEAADWPASEGTAAPGAAAPSLPAEEQGLLDPNEADAYPEGGVDEAGGVVAMAPPPSPKLRLAAVGKRHNTSVGFFQVVRDPRYRPAIVAVIGIMFAQQVCGINSVIMYSVSLLNGMLPVSSALLTIVISVVNLVTTIACAPLPDRLGRKACLIYSIAGQGSSSFVLAFSIVYEVKILSALSVLAFVAFFAVGLGPVPFIMASELVGQEAVGATQSWALGANYIATFLVAQFFPLVNSALNQRFGRAGWVYILFSVLAMLSAIFIAVYVPETKGKKNADEVWGRTTRVD
ncbi:major facilitator superfamily transporter glucose [Niveomyces insectorum RCEF 264]|uniref:Major facilitator superfamily transporter glucose n=1 Tax=Niveomyces insectorum RCEF 264 TaxID=1081102 RepID=A0A167Y4R7_9HYPO|nr:major facilitator superfamily transporter glucose [Niveomyces insectorum RCEF 264]